MKIKSIIAFASAGLLLGSCGIYNKYERPDVNVKGLVRDSASIADTLAVATLRASATCLGAASSPILSCSRSSSRD